MVNNTSKIKKLGEAYKGTISTFIVTLTILGIGFFLPMISANEIQNAREGKGRYTPTEFMCFDINEIGNFDNDFIYTHPPDTVYNQGNGAFFWRYFVEPYQRVVFVQSQINMIYNSLEGTVDNYVTGHTTSAPGTTYDQPGNECWFALEITWGEFLELDVTRIDIYVDGIPSTTAGGVLVSLHLSSGGHLRSGYIGKSCVIGEKTSIKVTVEDLIEIKTLPSSEQIIIRFSTDYVFVPNLDIIFDMQFYNLRAKTNAITLLSIWYVVQSIGIFMLGFVMLPQISIGRLSELLGLTKEW